MYPIDFSFGIQLPLGARILPCSSNPYFWGDTQDREGQRFPPLPRARSLVGGRTATVAIKPKPSSPLLVLLSDLPSITSKGSELGGEKMRAEAAGDLEAAVIEHRPHRALNK